MTAKIWMFETKEEMDGVVDQNLCCTDMDMGTSTGVHKLLINKSTTQHGYDN